jgi:hypothetical protein
VHVRKGKYGEKKQETQFLESGTPEVEALADVYDLNDM